MAKRQREKAKMAKESQDVHVIVEGQMNRKEIEKEIKKNLFCDKVVKLLIKLIVLVSYLVL